MLIQNYDDHDRSEHYGSRDYAKNFLESCEENAIIFTYGDNDTYPLWYAQEVENIRRDVRVVNLSLITVDWYIEKLTKKVNDSAPIKLSIPSEEMRGRKRNQLFFVEPDGANRPINVYDELKFIQSNKSVYQDQFLIRSRNLFIPIDRNKVFNNGILSVEDTANVVNKIDINFRGPNYITKDQLAIMDLIANNIYDRPIYFAITSNPEKLLGLQDYTQMEGLGLRVVPVKSQSDRSLYIYGSGRVAPEKVYDNVMNKWTWGNFDKEEAYISTSYGAELQAMKMVMLRTSAELGSKGDPASLEKAANLCEKYFEAFPSMNFPYDSSVFPFIEILIKGERKEAAKKHMRILAETTAQKLRFYDSLDEDEFASFKEDFRYAMRSADDILRNVGKIGDAALTEEMNALLGQYDTQKMQRN